MLFYMLPFKDISENQGQYNMALNSDPIIAIRMSTGVLMRFDLEASRNYSNAIAADKVVINYHYAGRNDPIVEAKLFISAVQPFAENDVYCLDAELGQTKAWKESFVNYVHDQTSAWPLDYMNISTANALGPCDNCGLWLAAPSWGFNETIVGLNPNLVYVAQQGPIVNGVDTNMWFGTLDQLKAYGYHLPSSPTPPITPPTPVQPENPPTPPQQGSEQSANTQPEPVPPVPPTPIAPNTPTKQDNARTLGSPSQHSTPHISFDSPNWWQTILAFIRKLLRG